MAINSLGQNAALYAEPKVSTEVKDKTALGKDDFMTLLLVELQHQDPTEPMDSEKILTQTSQLAGLESSENTNKALEELAATLGGTQQFSTIAAIGKTADLGSNAITYDEGSSSSFEVYFPSDIQQGSIQVVDSSGSLIKTLDVGTNKSGVYQFDWDGKDNNGNEADSGIYYVNASYTDPDGNNLETRLGAYPIESVRFDGGQTLVKVGSNYVPLENIKEVY
ncbi:flagellar hook capping protein [Candidatus Sulfurimonas marisnigri]|uniref:Basal-body rod modification protein FlgD n=1 Tax=Candidatus Sulfurimonas marisnigri TaxID=2740405 RepID=A0A7S7RQM0_9BACT|nr:FlgD immunoglobulin-like domain containing protein [Candidatus Sulfurimonas marisnigri]QOY54703.1 flagellar hook capping protein [Candidatus Sulfurimonas marisnigri]